MEERPYSDEERRQLRLMNSLRDLVSTEAWKAYVDFLNDVTREFHSKVLSPSTNIEGLIASEYAKGAVYGLTQAMTLPEHIIKVTKEQVLRDAPESEA